MVEGKKKHETPFEKMKKKNHHLYLKKGKKMSNITSCWVPAVKTGRNKEAFEKRNGRTLRYSRTTAF